MWAHRLCFFGHDGCLFWFHDQRWNKFNVAIPSWSWVSPSAYVGTDKFLINLCAGAPTWYCNFTSYSGGGLAKEAYASGGGLYSISPALDPWRQEPSSNYVRVELTWTALTPALTGGTVTCNYHIILPNYLTELGKFPVRQDVSLVAGHVFFCCCCGGGDGDVVMVMVVVVVC
jgi:hypothetical protein